MIKKRFTTLVRFIYSLTVAVGAVLLLYYGQTWFQGARPIPHTEVYTSTPKLTPMVQSGIPVHISIPSLKIDLPVGQGVYDPRTGEWSLSNDRAYYAMPTMPLNNEAGNTLIYGHNIRTVFAKLHEIKKDDVAILNTDTGLIFTYKFRSAESVAPTDTQIFAYEGAPQLTLQTCTGLWSQDRRMHYFDLVSVVKQ